MKINPEIKIRQDILKHAIGNEAVAIVATAPQAGGNVENIAPYRQASDFYYLTAFPEPEAMAVFIPGRTGGEYILFSEAISAEATLWHGGYTGQERALKDYGADQSFPIADAGKIIPELLLDKKHIYFDFGSCAKFDQEVLGWINAARRKIKTGINVPEKFFHLGNIVHEMRLTKSQTEIILMRQAAEISVNAHLAAMRACRSEMYEYELVAALQYQYLRHGALPAFKPIVAAGSNSCVLHYALGNAKVKNGDLILIDAGASYHHYASDITRTFPVDTKFSPEQRAIYAAVLTAQQEIIKKVRPGARWDELAITANRVICSELLEIGILRGELETAIQTEQFKKFYPHRFGHWLGLDVHDVGYYAIDHNWRFLEPGMVFTVEPGIYIPKDAADVDPKWHGIGVRIEDNILVTESGYENLTSAVPKEINAIEALRKEAFGKQNILC